MPLCHLCTWRQFDGIRRNTRNAADLVERIANESDVVPVWVDSPMLRIVHEWNHRQRNDGKHFPVAARL